MIHALALAVTALAALQSVVVHAIPTISAVNAKFFTSEGRQWYVKGVAYQLSTDDPLADPDQCKLDVTLMKELGVNTIRVYHVDPQKDHTGCMSALEEAGIYLMVDLDSFNSYILPQAPDWNQTGFHAYRAILDEFQKFDNTAAVFVGNEVLNNAGASGAAPYVLAAARDIKQYRDQKEYRKIPVGYSAADVGDLRPMLQNYFVCRPDPQERMDFFGLNSYEWCGPTQTYEGSGYANLQAMSANYSIPIFFSETGCMTVPPRNFADQAAIFGPQMENTWSGSIIYEWLQEENKYGLVTYGDPDAAIGQFGRHGQPTTISPDYANLKSQWATLSPSGVALSTYSTISVTPVACPTSAVSGSYNWPVDPSARLPTLGVPGNVTGTPSSSTTADPTKSDSNSGGGSSVSASATSSGSSPSPKHTGGAGKMAANPFGTSTKTSSEDQVTFTVALALIAVGMGFAWWC